MNQVHSRYSGRSYALWVVLNALAFLVQSGLAARAQLPATPNGDATLESWRTYGSSAASKAKAAAAALPPDRRNEARSLFSTAFDLADGGNLDAAEIAFERGLAIDPSNGAAEYYLADTLVKMKQLNEALPHYATAMGLAPNAKEGIEAEAALRKLLPAIAAARAAASAEKARKDQADRAAAAENARRAAAAARAAADAESARQQQKVDTANSCMRQCTQQSQSCIGAQPATPDFGALCGSLIQDMVQHQACLDRSLAQFQNLFGVWVQNRQRCTAQLGQCQGTCKQACGSDCTWQ